MRDGVAKATLHQPRLTLAPFVHSDQYSIPKRRETFFNPLIHIYNTEETQQARTCPMDLKYGVFAPLPFFTLPTSCFPLP
ncbi:hypothetical protein M0804_001892 [Polistes exclamans]|nr:hypothetical protein M0804_001892 [Polistes exclamans]